MFGRLLKTFGGADAPASPNTAERSAMAPAAPVSDRAMLEPEDALVPVSDAIEATPSRAGPVVVFEDAVAPLVVGALSGKKLRRLTERAHEERLAAGGDVHAGYSGGALHLWGVGVEGDRASRDRRPTGFKAIPDLDWTAHALRGPYSVGLLWAAGINAPTVYGDPIWFAPKVLRFDASPKRFELGVVLPLGHNPTTALERAAARRFEVPKALADTVDLIDQSCAATPQGLAAVARRIGRCKRLLVATPRMMALAEALGVPAVLIGRGGGGLQRQRVDDDLIALPAQARDLYAGLGAVDLLVARQPAGEPTEWELLIQEIDQLWEPVPYDARPFFDAFPMDAQQPFEAERWATPRGFAPLGERRRSSAAPALSAAAEIASTLRGGGGTSSRKAASIAATEADAGTVVAARRAAVMAKRAKRSAPSDGGGETAA